MPKVFIIILHLGNFQVLKECLISCRNISYPDHEIIIINNGPDSRMNLNTMSKLDDNLSLVINNNSNLGYARGNNIGVREAVSCGADWVMLLNDDTVVSEDFLSILLETAEKSPDTGMVGPKIFYYDSPESVWFDGAHFDFKTCSINTLNSYASEINEHSAALESDYITGCALLIKSHVIDKIGLLNERFFLYWEDVDWGLRAKKAGLKNFVVPQSRIWHKVSASTGGMDSLLRAYHKTRSHLLMASLYAPAAMTRLHVSFFRDIAWLLIKSSDKNRVLRARAYMAAIIDYHRGRTDGGPNWLWNKQ